MINNFRKTVFSKEECLKQGKEKCKNLWNNIIQPKTLTQIFVYDSAIGSNLLNTSTASIFVYTTKNDLIQNRVLNSNDKYFWKNDINSIFSITLTDKLTY